MGIKAALEDTKDANEVHGTIAVDNARYDGIMISAQVTDSNSLVSFVSCNGKEADGSKSRLFVPRADIPNGKIEFVASIEPAIKGEIEVRLRAAIIEQHKEVDSSIVFRSAVS